MGKLTEFERDLGPEFGGLVISSHVEELNGLEDDNGIRKLKMSGALGQFRLRSEDKILFTSMETHEQLVAAQEESSSKNAPKIVGMAGVFDGHDGGAASEYCSEGIMQHILAEVSDSFHINNDQSPASSSSCSIPTMMNGVETKSVLEAGLINAFYQAQERFGMKMKPPTLEDFRLGGVDKTRAKRLGALKRMLNAAAPPRRGGTTALVLCLLAEQDKKNQSSSSPYSVVVANTGDSRCLTDDASGTSHYRQITTDHRLFTRSEVDRIESMIAAKKSPHAYVNGYRLYPGGLMVTRTIGDLAMSSLAVCTPDIFHFPLFPPTTPTTTSTTNAEDDDAENHNNSNSKQSSSSSSSQKVEEDKEDESTRCHVQRFILGSDGLFDVLTNDMVGTLGARWKTSSSSSSSAAQDTTTTNDVLVSNDDDGSVEMSSQQKQKQQKQKEFVPPKEAADAILEQCLKKGGYDDDISVMVIDIQISPT